MYCFPLINRTTGSFDSMLQLYAGTVNDAVLQVTLARFLEQILIPSNRMYLSEHNLCDQVWAWPVVIQRE